MSGEDEMSGEDKDTASDKASTSVSKCCSRDPLCLFFFRRDLNVFTIEERSRRVGAAFRTPFLRHSTAKPEEASLQNSIQEATKAVHGHNAHDQTNCNTKASG